MEAPSLPPGAVALECKAFKDAFADGTNRILSDPTLLHDGRRVCMDVAAVRRRRLGSYQIWLPPRGS